MKGSLKAYDRDLSRRAVHLNFVVSFCLITQYFPYLRYGSYILPGAGPHDAILKPPVGPLDLPFCLRRKGVYHFDAKVKKHLFPLGICFVRFRIVLPPYGVPLFYKTEYRMIVYIVGKGQTISGAQRFQRADVTPTRLLFHDLRIEQVSAVVVEAGDKVQLVGNIGRPSMVG